MVLRRSKKGRVFYGCSDYPECSFVSWDKPTGEVCPQCHTGFMVEKNTKKGKVIICNNKECNYEQKPVEESENEE